VKTVRHRQTTTTTLQRSGKHRWNMYT